MVATGISTASLAALLAAACLGSGCSSLGYYGQSIGGHLDLVARARPVDDWTADATTTPELRERLALSQRIRAFAVTELALPDNRSYRRYADLNRPVAVWNVVAAPELSLTLQTWCFPVVGCVGYRGYYDQAAAEARGHGLARRWPGSRRLRRAGVLDAGLARLGSAATRCSIPSSAGPKANWRG